ncbi:MAG: tetratricopeptide repeat protein [Bryobacteraceae bacterium]
MLFSLILQALLLPQTGVPDADREIAAGRFDQAETILIRALEADSGNFELTYRLGLVLLKQEKNVAALARLERAVRIEPRAAPAWLALSQARLRTGSRSKALEAVEEAFSLAPRDEMIGQARLLFLLQVMESDIRADQPLQAIELGDKILGTTDPAGQAAIHNLLGRAYIGRGDGVQAAKSLQEAIRLNPEEVSYYLDLARLFLEHRTPEPAGVLLEAAQRRFPDNLEVVRMQGLVYYARGRNQEALGRFLQVIDQNPDRVDVWASLDTLLPNAGDRMPEIVQKLQAFCKRHPSEPLGFYLLALTGAQDKKNLLQHAITVDPEFWPAHFELHKALKDQGQLAGAAKALKQTVKLQPDFAPAHHALAQVYGALGDRDRARQEREIHHKLLNEQRAAAEKRNHAMPRLSYELPRR